MTWEAWLTIGVVLLAAYAMVRSLAGPDTVLLGAVTLLMSLSLASDRFPSPPAVLASFGNVSLITIGVLFVVAEGLRQTGAMDLITRPLLGRPRSVLGAQVRLMLPVAGLSAFLNNTPIVAMFIPVVTDWSRKAGINSSKLLIPLSYAAIMGGSCTLIGTATNLFVDGMVRAAEDDPGFFMSQPLGMFTITAVGVPAALAGLAYLLVVSRWLLPDRAGVRDEAGDLRQYTVEMIVESESPIDGKTIEQAGLRHLPGAYLMEVERQGERMVAVGPEFPLHGGDRLIFVGVVDSVVDLQKIRGLAPATDQVFKLDAAGVNRRLVEAVVSDACPIVRQTIRDGRFRTRYNAAVIAVHRGGEHLQQKVGDIVLKPGDTLLLEAHPNWTERFRNNRDFYLVSTVEDSQPTRHNKAWLALAILAAMVLAATLTPLPLVNAALLAAGLMILTRCCTMGEARTSIRWNVLLTMGAALGLGVALDSTGAAAGAARAIVGVAEPFGPRALLAAIYLVAMVFTSLIGPIGTVGLMFPIARAAAAAQGYDFMPFTIALMMTAAASFATPTAYQTNLMVYGVGGYRFGDFVRVGAPLNFLVMAVTITLAPMIWPMTP